MSVERAPVRQTVESEIRETYEEYDLRDATVAMIADPENEHAWIQSDVVTPISP